ncbi:hypothetical protein Sste5346_008449 [Sporothrix stenoceras]|uniref:dihydroneopterin aldolase n=1 Tax=Sporothrix stenoceras TaxID=5173 RepID=A0ABR3YQJ9_9PEZI
MPNPTAWDVQAAIGEPRAVIRVRNLQTTLGPKAGQDAWGRNGRPQPAVISAEAVLAAPFPEAADTDRVAGDTVHYGSLGKEILKSMKNWDTVESVPAGERRTPITLGHVMAGLWIDLAGQLDERGTIEFVNLPEEPPTLLTSATVRSLSATIMLPKASLVGEGVSLTSVGILEGKDESPSPKNIASTTLRLHRLRVPTLVGVHPHERTAKQAVVADIALDRYYEESDVYTQLEAFVVQIMATSYFETLEALATHIARKILKEFRPAGTFSDSAPRYHDRRPSWYVHVALEKPIAVPSADAPVVEVRMGAEHL